MILINQRSQGRVTVAASACRCLRCLDCRPRRLAVWLNHLRGRILKAGRVFVGRATPGREWGTIGRSIRRAGGECARIVDSHADPLIVSTVDFSGSLPFDPAQAVEAVAEALLKVPFKVGRAPKLISASNGWRLAERRRGRHRCVARITHGQFVAVLSRAAECGILSNVSIDDLGKRGDIRLPNEWSGADRAAFFGALRGCPSIGRTRLRSRAV